MKRRALPMALTVVVAAAVVIGGLTFSRFVQESLWQESVTDVLEVTSQGRHALDAYLGTDFNALDLFVAEAARVDGADEAAIGAAIELFDRETDDSTYLTVDLASGRLYRTGDQAASNVLDEDQVDALREMPESGILQPFLDEVTGVNSIAVYKKFTFADGTQAFARKARPVSTLVDEFSLTFYDNTGFFYVVNAQGDVLVRSMHSASNRTFANIFDIVRRARQRRGRRRILRGVARQGTERHRPVRVRRRAVPVLLHADGERRGLEPGVHHPQRGHHGAGGRRPARHGGPVHGHSHRASGRAAGLLADRARPSPRNRAHGLLRQPDGPVQLGQVQDRRERPAGGRPRRPFHQRVPQRRQGRPGRRPGAGRRRRAGRRGGGLLQHLRLQAHQRRGRLPARRRDPHVARRGAGRRRTARRHCQQAFRRPLPAGVPLPRRAGGRGALPSRGGPRAPAHGRRQAAFAACRPVLLGRRARRHGRERAHGPRPHRQDRRPPRRQGAPSVQPHDARPAVAPGGFGALHGIGARETKGSSWSSSPSTARTASACWAARRSCAGGAPAKGW